MDVFSKFAELLLYLYNTSMGKVRPEEKDTFHTVYSVPRKI